MATTKTATPEPVTDLIATDDGRWEALRAPFTEGQIERLPKPVRKNDDDKGRCEQGSRYSADGYHCGGWHTRSVHLSYVGHAGVTDRLNSVDPTWAWEPMALTEHGTPLFTDGGLWIRLTVLGVTRIGFGDAGGKSGTNAVKEIIGDALRNAAMRFGVGTYLWSKSADAQVLAAGGDLDADHQPAQPERTQEQRQAAPKPTQNVARIHQAMQPLNEEGRTIVRDFALEQFGQGWAPVEATDEQTDALVQYATSLLQSQQEQAHPQ